MKLNCILFAALFICAPAYGVYNQDCMNQLTETKAQRKAFMDWRNRWEPLVIESFHIRRELSAIEFEAYMDVIHDLALAGEFRNGKLVHFTNDSKSMRVYAYLVNSSELIEVTHTAASLRRLGEIYKKACELLGRENCALYDRYPGFGVEGARPLSRIQERAVKWSVFHMTSPQTMGDALKAARAGGSPDKIILEIHSDALKTGLKSANAVIRASFAEAESKLLLESLINVLIRESFERSLQVFQGRQMN